MRSTLAVAAICAGLFAFAGEAAAGVELSTSVTPMRVSYPQQRDLTYRLVMRTGEQQERLTVGGEFSGGYGGYFSPMLEGPGTLSQVENAHGDPWHPAVSCPRDRLGGASDLSAYAVILPPHSTSVLVVRRTLYRPPREASELQGTYWISGFDPAAPNSRPPVFTLHSPQPDLAVRGVHIELKTQPHEISRYKPATTGIGESILIRGQTSPELAGQVIVLRATRLRLPPFSVSRLHVYGANRGVGATATIARVRVRPNGSFQTRWRPRTRARWGIYALYRSQDPTRSDDSTDLCIPIDVR